MGFLFWIKGLLILTIISISCFLNDFYTNFVSVIACKSNIRNISQLVNSVYQLHASTFITTLWASPFVVIACKSNIRIINTVSCWAVFTNSMPSLLKQLCERRRLSSSNARVTLETSVPTVMWIKSDVRRILNEHQKNIHEVGRIGMGHSRVLYNLNVSNGKFEWTREKYTWREYWWVFRNFLCKKCDKI